MIIVVPINCSLKLHSKYLFNAVLVESDKYSQRLSRWNKMVWRYIDIIWQYTNLKSKNGAYLFSITKICKFILLRSNHCCIMFTVLIQFAVQWYRLTVIRYTIILAIRLYNNTWRLGKFNVITRIVQDKEKYCIIERLGIVKGTCDDVLYDSIMISTFFFSCDVKSL